MQSVLVVGGAGYIGSHTVRQLLKKSFKVVVADNLSTGSKASLPSNVEFHEIDVLNISGLRKVFAANKFNAVFHFAAKLSVPESFPKHFEYFDTNVVGTRNLLNLCEEFGINRFVFSSTAAVYGNVKSGLVKENDPYNPQNPYGLTKQLAESLVLNQAEIQNKFKYRILRYFNVAGAELDGSNGPRNLNSGQLIMNLCKSAIGSKKISVFGTDYDTKDGTAIRDYIHVVDLAEAHLEALNCLDQGGQSGIWNCGYGQGYSVMELIRAFEKASGVELEIQLNPRRQGDPEQVTADNSLIIKESQWRPKHNDISVICKSSFEWIKNGIKQ